MNERWVETIRTMEDAGRIDIALDLVYAMFDTLMERHDYDRADAILATINPCLFGVDLLIGFLVATLPAKHELKSRHGLYAKTEAELRTRGAWSENLLSGL